MGQRVTIIFDGNVALVNLTNISASILRCPAQYQVYYTLWAAAEILSAVLGFPGCLVLLYKVAQRFLLSGQRGRGRRSCIYFTTSSDLLLVNLSLTGVFNTVAMMLHASNNLPGTFHLSPEVITALNTVVFTAGPLGMASVCLDCYLAVVHPMRYPHLKTTWRHPLLLSVAMWTYVVVTETIVIVQGLPMYNLIWIGTFVVTLPVMLFLTISMLFALRLAGPGRRRLADLCPPKRQAFLMVVSILVGFALYCLPQVIMYIGYHTIYKVSFRCAVFPAAMVIPTAMVSMVSVLFASRQIGVKLCGCVA